MVKKIFFFVAKSKCMFMYCRVSFWVHFCSMFSSFFLSSFCSRFVFSFFVIFGFYKVTKGRRLHILSLKLHAAGAVFVFSYWLSRLNTTGHRVLLWI